MCMKTIKKIFPYLRSSLFFLLFGMLFALIQVGFTLYIPVVIGEVIDLMVGVGNVSFAEIYPKLWLIFICLMGAAVFTYLYELFLSIVTQRSIQSLRNDLFRKWNHVPISYLDTHRHGDLLSRSISDVESVADGLLEGFKQLYRGIMTILITIVFMFFINWLLALVVILITPLSLFVASFIARRSHRYFQDQSNIRGEVGGYVLEMIENQKIVKSMNYEAESVHHFDMLADQLHDAGVKAVFMGSTINPSTRFVNGVVYAFVGVLGAILILTKPIPSLLLTVGELSSFLFYSNQYAKPFNEISGVVSEIQTAFTSLNRIWEVLNQDEEIEIENTLSLSTIESIQWNHVYFSYQKDRPLIEDFHYEVKKGSRIAIVGPTGCGKTTLINLLLRFYDVQQGAICLNGIPVTSLSRKEVRRHYGMVLQDTWIFEGTIYDNIRYGKKEATKEEVIAVCKRAHAHGFIKRLPQGYDTMISRHSGLSQGEKQLLTIARVMLMNPEIVILDEATSSIDTRTEKKIDEAFHEMMEGKTSFIIAHRLSTIRNADCILVMKDGNIIEIGNHQQLLQKNGFYAELYNSQFAE